MEQKVDCSADQPIGLLNQMTAEQSHRENRGDRFFILIDNHSAGKIRDGAGHSARSVGGQENRRVGDFRERA